MTISNFARYRRKHARLSIEEEIFFTQILFRHETTLTQLHKLSNEKNNLNLLIKALKNRN